MADKERNLESELLKLYSPKKNEVPKNYTTSKGQVSTPTPNQIENYINKQSSKKNKKKY